MLKAEVLKAKSRKLKWGGRAAGIVLLLLGGLCGPGATWLQIRHEWADPAQQWDAAYLVCGAQAQNRRIAAMTGWLAQTASQASHEARAPLPTMLVGNDPYEGLWCRQHQTNHTRTEWAVEKLETWLASHTNTITHRDAPPSHAPRSTDHSPRSPTVVPGEFLNTDGEMIALAKHLEVHPEIQSIALCTSRFHGRRLLQRYRKHIGDHPRVGIIPGVGYWGNRAPWIVLGEYLKLLRDRLGLTNHVTRPEFMM